MMEYFLVGFAIGVIVFWIAYLIAALVMEIKRGR